MKAAEQEDASGESGVAYCYLDGLGVEEDPDQALIWFLRAGEHGDDDAQNVLGNTYFSNSELRDWSNAFYWYGKAAEQDNVYAQCSLGRCYEHGYGTKKDPQKAFYWYRKAAEQDYGEACYYLCNCYRYGTGTERNIKLAKEWYRIASDEGREDADKALNELKWPWSR